MRLRILMSILFCFTAVVPLITFWLWPETSAINKETAEARDRHYVMAHSFSLTLEHYYSDLSSVFTYVTKDVAKTRDAAGYVGILQRSDIRNVCAINADTGKLISSINFLGSNCNQQLTKEKLDWMKKQLGDEVVSSTNVIHSEQFGNGFHLISLQNNILFHAFVSTYKVIELAKEVTPSEAYLVVVLDPTGKAIYHPINGWHDERKDLSNLPVVQRILKGEYGVEEFESPENEAKMVGGLTKVNNTGWGVMVFQPVDQIHNRLEDVKFSALPVLLLALAIGLILAYFASKILTEPIEQIVQAMRRIGDGELRAYEQIKKGKFQPAEFGNARDSVKDMAKKLQENMDTITKHAYLDGITGLPNRECFRVLAQQEIEKLEQSGKQGAVLFLDLDGFKQVNDVYGHRGGDDLLLAFSKRLHAYCGIYMQRYARGLEHALTIMPARLGGDEFVVFLGNIEGQQIASEFANGLFDRVFGEYHLHNGVVLQVSGSVGGAIYPTQAREFDELLRLADIAMYDAKNSGKGRFCLHSTLDQYDLNSPSLDASLM